MCRLCLVRDCGLAAPARAVLVPCTYGHMEWFAVGQLMLTKHKGYRAHKVAYCGSVPGSMGPSSMAVLVLGHISCLHPATARLPGSCGMPEAEHQSSGVIALHFNAFPA